MQDTICVVKLIPFIIIGFILCLVQSRVNCSVIPSFPGTHTQSPHMGQVANLLRSIYALIIRMIIFITQSMDCNLLNNKHTVMQNSEVGLCPTYPERVEGPNTTCLALVLNFAPRLCTFSPGKWRRTCRKFTCNTV